MVHVLKTGLGREKCKKLSAFALPQKPVSSVVMGVYRVTRFVYEKIAQTFFASIVTYDPHKSSVTSCARLPNYQLRK
jgi:hypothetical protein